MNAPISFPDRFPIEGEILPSTQRANQEVGSFGETLAEAVRQAGDAERTANEMTEAFANGTSEAGIHETMVAVEKARIQIHYAVTLKNKMIESYRELMNTNV